MLISLMKNDLKKIIIAQNIRKIRIIKGFSQVYVGDQLALSQSAYSKIECGKTSLSDDTTDKICVILDVDKKLLETFHENKLFNKL